MLSDDEVLDVARLGLATEAHYGAPQDIEWAMAQGRIYLVQSRPVTAVGASEASGATPSGPEGGAVLVRGPGRLGGTGLGCGARAAHARRGRAPAGW